MLIPLPREVSLSHLTDNHGYLSVNAEKIIGIVEGKIEGESNNTILKYGDFNNPVLFVYTGICANELRRNLNQLEREFR